MIALTIYFALSNVHSKGPSIEDGVIDYLQNEVLEYYFVHHSIPNTIAQLKISKRFTLEDIPVWDLRFTLKKQPGANRFWKVTTQFWSEGQYHRPDTVLPLVGPREVWLLRVKNFLSADEPEYLDTPENQAHLIAAAVDSYFELRRGLNPPKHVSDLANEPEYLAFCKFRHKRKFLIRVRQKEGRIKELQVLDVRAKLTYVYQLPRPMWTLPLVKVTSTKFVR